MLLRKKPSKLSTADAPQMFRNFGFYDRAQNQEGKGIFHQYKEKNINGDKVIFDESTSLMWQQSGSDNWINFEDANKYIEQLNKEKYAGYEDWRLPTLEEGMSLIEPEKGNNDLYIDSRFDKTQTQIWTCDIITHAIAPRAWTVSIHLGGSWFGDIEDDRAAGVRAVRSV